MLEERGEEFTSTEEMMKQPAEREEGPIVTEVSDRRVSIGEVPAIVAQEEKLQEQEQQEPKISKRKQKRRTTSYLSNISKQVEKNGNQINKITMMVQSIQKQKQIKSIKGAEVSKLPLQLKQVQAQVSQLQKQLTGIQNKIQKIRIASASQVGFRKQSSIAMRSKSKKSKSSKASNRKQKAR
jgi:hypothetical protein